MYHNPLFAIDFYKVDHRRQYPKGTTEIYSNFTPRYVKECHSLLHDFDNQVVVFGIQSFVISYLVKQWECFFFNEDKEIVIEEYRDVIQTALGIDYFNCSHLEALHDLGYLPIRIKAIDEGFRVPIGVPILTIVNTHPEFFWLTNYLETIISASIWKPITSATIAFEFKRLLTKYAQLTGCDESFIDYQAHDFSFRGMSGWSDATLSGAAHLTSFKGTDCVSAIDLLNNQYEGHVSEDIVGCSVPATEHSVMCCGGSDGEFDTIKRLITDVYPSGIVSIVADSYNLWTMVTEYLPNLYPEIMNRKGKVVVRPDSGNPVDIICGDESAEMGSPAHLGVLYLLWNIFGGTINEIGYRELDSHIGLIYGDAITVDRAALILQRMKDMGFSSSNIVFGVGSFTYQYVTRDTFGFAMKATSAVINGQRHEIYKDPITASDGNKKKSARGLLYVGMNQESGKFYLSDDVHESKENEGYLHTIFENGELTRTASLWEIRHRLAIELQQLSE